MITKVYAIFGRTTANILIPAGDGSAFIKCEFTKGCINGGPNYRPAVYATNSATEQDIIENSLLFLNGIIQLYRCYGELQESPQKKNVAPEKKEIAVYEDVTDKESAVQVLKSLGAKATTLASVEKMREFMTNKGISFPNYNL